MDAIADTCFYIDLQRSRKEALDWLASNSRARLIMTAITYGELAVGLPDASKLANLIGTGETCDIDLRAAAEFGRIARYLRVNGLMIGYNDLWIASIAISKGLPLLTNNVKEFNRVPGLAVTPYG